MQHNFGTVLRIINKKFQETLSKSTVQQTSRKFGGL